MQGVVIDNILEARNLGDLEYVNTILSNNSILADIAKYAVKRNTHTSDSYKNVKVKVLKSTEEGENQSTIDEDGDEVYDASPNDNASNYIEEEVVKHVGSTISNTDSKSSFSEWQLLKRYLIDYIINNEAFIDKVETVYHLSKNELYETVFGKFFDHKHYIKLIHDSIDYNSLMKKVKLDRFTMLTKNISYGLYIINGIPKSGKQLAQLYMMNEIIKSKEKVLNINCGERPDTITQMYYPEYYKAHKDLLTERIISSDILTLVNTIAKSKSKFIFVNSINSIIDNNSSGVITKGGLDRNAMELIARIINYCALEFNKIVVAVYRSQPSDDKDQVKSIFSGISNGVISLPNARYSANNFEDGIHFDNRTSGEFDEESVVINLNEIKNLIDPKLVRV